MVLLTLLTMLSVGYLQEEYVLQRAGEVLSQLRQCGVALRWVLLISLISQSVNTVFTGAVRAPEGGGIIRPVTAVRVAVRWVLLISLSGVSQVHSQEGYMLQRAGEVFGLLRQCGNVLC
jgi:hypothetical protein